MSGRSEIHRAHLGMLLWALIVGLSFPAVAHMSEGLPPLLLTALRFALAAVALCPLVARTPGARPGLAGAVLYGFMGLCIAGFFGAMFWAAHRASALSLSTLYVSVPLLAYGLGRALGVERRDGWLLLALVLGALGALALNWSARHQQDGLRLGPGELGFFAGCVGSALYPVLTKWGLRKGWLPPQAAPRTFFSLLAGSALIGLLGLLTESPRRLGAMTVVDALLLLYLGVISSGLTFWLIQRATATLTPAKVTAYSYLVPFVSFLPLLIRGPSIGWVWMAAIALVVAAVALLLRGQVQAR